MARKQRPESQPSDGTWGLKPRGPQTIPGAHLALGTSGVHAALQPPRQGGCPTRAPSTLHGQALRPPAPAPQPPAGTVASETLGDTVSQRCLRLHASRGHPTLCRAPGRGRRPEPRPAGRAPLPPPGACSPHCSRALPPRTPAQGWPRHSGVGGSGRGAEYPAPPWGSEGPGAAGRGHARPHWPTPGAPSPGVPGAAQTPRRCPGGVLPPAGLLPGALTPPPGLVPRRREETGLRPHAGSRTRTTPSPAWPGHVLVPSPQGATHRGASGGLGGGAPPRPVPPCRCFPRTEAGPGSSSARGTWRLPLPGVAGASGPGRLRAESSAWFPERTLARVHPGAHRAGRKDDGAAAAVGPPPE